jgi:hypothetical protein
MTRLRIVGFATAVAAAAVLAQGLVHAQAAAPSKAQSAPATQKAPPAPATQKAPATPKAQAAEDKAAPAGGSTIGSVHIPNAVMADGKPLTAGTYTLRLSNDPVTPVVGQTPDRARWVEFVQGGTVKGREVATVLSTADAKQIAKQGLPAPGTSKVQTLKGNEFLRVWVNKGGTNYLVHLKNS